MVFRNVWASLVYYLSLLISPLVLSWLMVSSVKWTEGEYRGMAWSDAANLANWHFPAWTTFAICCSLVFVIIVTITCNILYKHFDQPTVFIDLVEEKLAIVKDFPSGVSIPNWEFKDIGCCSFVLYELKLSIGMGLQPISDNPKVRKLIYSTEFIPETGTPTQENMLQLVTKATTITGHNRVNDNITLEDALSRWLKSHLYEFNEKMSRDLARLYNPLDKGQQEAFMVLLREYFAPILAGSGLKLARCSFDLAQ